MHTHTLTDRGRYTHTVQTLKSLQTPLVTTYCAVSDLCRNNDIVLYGVTGNIVHEEKLSVALGSMAGAFPQDPLKASSEKHHCPRRQRQSVSLSRHYFHSGNPSVITSFLKLCIVCEMCVSSCIFMYLNGYKLSLPWLCNCHNISSSFTLILHCKNSSVFFSFLVKMSYHT